MQNLDGNEDIHQGILHLSLTRKRSKMEEKSKRDIHYTYGLWVCSVPKAILV